jgi:ATP-binding protein involved in chromosome partitioning
MPLEIVGLGRPDVRFVWDEGDFDVWTARALRLACTCAYCVSETTGEKLLDPATIPSELTVTTMALVGNYGVSIAFSDGHSTGIYRWKQLLANRPLRGAS